MIALLFFLSGATSLVGEVVWMRMLGLVLGNTVWAASAVVAVWMGGMALGAHLGGKLAPRTRWHLRLYGLAEGVIGGFFALSTNSMHIIMGQEIAPAHASTLSTVMMGFGWGVAAVGPLIVSVLVPYMGLDAAPAVALAIPLLALPSLPSPAEGPAPAPHHELHLEGARAGPPGHDRQAPA